MIFLNLLKTALIKQKSTGVIFGIFVDSIEYKKILF